MSAPVSFLSPAAAPAPAPALPNFRRLTNPFVAGGDGGGGGGWEYGELWDD